MTMASGGGRSTVVGAAVEARCRGRSRRRSAGCSFAAHHAAIAARARRSSTVPGRVRGRGDDQAVELVAGTRRAAPASAPTGCTRRRGIGTGSMPRAMQGVAIAAGSRARARRPGRRRRTQARNASVKPADAPATTRTSSTVDIDAVPLAVVARDARAQRSQARCVGVAERLRHAARPGDGSLSAPAGAGVAGWPTSRCSTCVPGDLELARQARPWPSRGTAGTRSCARTA